MSATVDDVLSLLDEMNEQGRIEYADYSQLHDSIAATLGEDEKLLDLAHHAWDIAVCAMHGMPIPASWGNSVENGLRERGIDVDKLPYVVPDATLGGGECELVEVDSYRSDMEIIHVLECSACGKTCEHVNGSYPKCPHCGARAVKR